MRDGGGQHYDVRSLKRAVAAAVVGYVVPRGAPPRNWNKRAFTDLLKDMVGLEKAGAWDQAWSPKIVLRDLKSEARRVGVGYDCAVRAAAERVYGFLVGPGEKSRGTDVDIAAVEDALNISVVVLQESGHVYCRAARHHAIRRHYIFLYWQNEHYQQAALQGHTGRIKSHYEGASTWMTVIHLSDCGYTA